MDKIDVMKIEQSNLSSLEKVLELQAQTTSKVQELVEGYNEVMERLEQIVSSLESTGQNLIDMWKLVEKRLNKKEIKKEK